MQLLMATTFEILTNKLKFETIKNETKEIKPQIQKTSALRMEYGKYCKNEIMANRLKFKQTKCEL